MFAELVKRLSGTRDNLKDICEEIGQDMPEEGSLPILQCVNCLLWASKRHFVIEEDNVPVCDLCNSVHLLRF